MKEAGRDIGVMMYSERKKKITKPLTELTKRNKGNWVESLECQAENAERVVDENQEARMGARYARDMQNE